MTDLVERLRRGLRSCDQDQAIDVMEEAAREIKRLRAKIERWEAQSIAQYTEIERLREQVDALRLVATSHEPEALRLQAEIEWLRAALQDIARMPLTAGAATYARRALEPKP